MFKFSDILKFFRKNNLSESIAKSQKGILDTFAKLESGADNFSDERIVTKELTRLLELFPDSPGFLGKHNKYPKPKKRFFFFVKTLPDLGELREAVSKPIEKMDITATRAKIKKLQKHYMHFPDVHALNAIQVFNDTIQSGVDEKKIDVLKSSFIEMANAICNGGISIFNITWFIKIYLKYLEVLNEKYIREYNATQKHYHQTVRGLAYDLHKKQIQLLSLITIKEKLGGLTLLNQKLRGSKFFREGITKDEVRDACKAILHEDENKSISEGKTAKHIFWVLITETLLFAKIPVFRKLILDTLQFIPDLSRDMILHKAMITTMCLLTDFRLAYAKGDTQSSKKISSELFNHCVELIDQYLEYTILTKPHELDPFLKAAWIAKESQGLYPEHEYKKVINQAMAFLDIVIGKRGQVKGSFDQASNLKEELINIKIQHGWPI